jgi:hypothetical protein
MENKSQGVVIGGETYHGSVLYWSIVAVVVGVFLVTTFTYWSGTIEILDDSAVSKVEIRRPLPPVQNDLYQERQ